MSSKTKIVVLHLKEVIYTGIFAVLAILFIIILLIMFAPSRKEEAEVLTVETPAGKYVPGVYTTTLDIGDNALDIEVVVDEEQISSVRLVNLSESVTTMYPLIEPSFEELVAQILEKQSLEEISYPEGSHYTSLVLLDAIRTSLEKAVK